MAWSNKRRSPAEKLTLVADWHHKGLVYWTQRWRTCDRTLRAADTSGAVGRALEQRQIAEEAIIRLFSPFQKRAF